MASNAAGSSSSASLEQGFEEEDELLMMIQGSESGWVEARTSCDHLGSLSSDLSHIPTADNPCNRCHHPSENWLCLSCKEVLCSRFVNKHMLQHYRQMNHCVVLSYSDLSIWCYACDAYLDAQVIMQLRPVYETAYILKYGEAPPFRTVESGWVEARTSCDHLGSLSSDLSHIPTPDNPCNRCHHPSENWLCLSCKEVLCSRFVNKHMLQHYRQMNHCVVLSYSDLSVWCYACDAYLDAQVIMQLRPVYETAHILKYGEAPPFRTVESRWAEARTSCDHLGSLFSNLSHIPTPDNPCNRFDFHLPLPPIPLQNLNSSNNFTTSSSGFQGI
ncbi:uncharacterized protein LOC110650096 [Hevea brasiliensis]|uniref:uncharacterized protein LOC110650096 n=1 Tax=Hevea brasiliensis TaxID=3981 RepID=UPI0025D243A4|nr:uncharacterized protein LOC110650096 [Hevea brasiliensis]